MNLPSYKPSINGIRPSNSTPYDKSKSSGLSKMQRTEEIKTNNPAPTTPSPRGHA